MGTVNAVLALAQGELGTRESPAGSNTVKYNTWYYGKPVSGKCFAWCMVFVQWVFYWACVDLPRLTASCGELMRAAKAAGQWVKGDYRPGDVVIYDFSGGTDTDHCGIVERVLDGRVVAIEGNTGAGSDADGGQVQRRTRSLSQVAGAVRPRFDEGEEEDMDLTRFKELWQEMRRELRDDDSAPWSGEARRWAVDTGLVQGSGEADAGYMWEDVMTREQVVTVLYRFAKLLEKSGGQ